MVDQKSLAALPAGSEYAIKVFLATLFTLPPAFCVREVGSGLWWLLAFVSVPFVVLVCVSLPEAEPSRIWETPPGGYPASFSDGWGGEFRSSRGWSSIITGTLPIAQLPMLMLFEPRWLLLGTFVDVHSHIRSDTDLVNVLFWNMNGFDCISVVAGEINEPARALPRGLLLALVAMLVTCESTFAYPSTSTIYTIGLHPLLKPFPTLLFPFSPQTHSPS